MPSLDREFIASDEKGFYFGTATFFIALASISQILRHNQLALGHGHSLWAGLLLRDTHLRFGFLPGACLYAIACIIMRLLPAGIQSLYIFSVFVVLRFSSVAIIEWILCDGPPDQEATLLNFNLWRLLCYLELWAFYSAYELTPLFSDLWKLFRLVTSAAIGCG